MAGFYILNKFYKINNEKLVMRNVVKKPDRVTPYFESPKPRTFY